MSDLFAWLLACASALGHPHPSKRIIQTIITACEGDVSCSEDAILYAAEESGVQVEPTRAYSWDARAGVSCGTWQTPCKDRDQSLLGRAKSWVHLRAYSLATYGDLRGLAGATAAGVRLTRARESEREDMRFGARWGQQ